MNYLTIVLLQVQNLTRIHRKNLVNLVGYCMEEVHLALVYEFMPQGTLQDQLTGTESFILLFDFYPESRMICNRNLIQKLVLFVHFFDKIFLSTER